MFWLLHDNIPSDDTNGTVQFVGIYNIIKIVTVLVLVCYIIDHATSLQDV